VRTDLAPFEMETALKLLRHFVCGEETLREWTDGLPINTDDHPLTQYQTRFSVSPMSHHTMFAEIAESPWPRLTNLEAAGVGESFRERLEVFVRANRLALNEQWNEARELLPGDGRFRLFDGMRRSGKRYRAVKKRDYSE